MPESPIKEFGKRRPAIPTVQPVKRSSHVALLLMGTFAVGGGAYALMPRQSCGPSQPGMASDLQPKVECTSRGYWPRGHWSGGWSSRSNFFGGDSTSSRSPSGAASDSGGVTRGGFGSFARAFGFSGG
jgi:hypothetical protein